MFHSSNAPANSSWQAFSCRGPRKAAIGKVNALVLSWLFSISVSVAQSNVVFIFVDDFGWGDVNAYRELFGFTPNLDDKDGNSITPNMDALAAQGTLFTEGYVASPVCTPSRVGVLTGIEPPRFGLHDFLNSKNANDSRNMNDWLDPHTMTAPRWFQNAGYATGLFGKWHMGGGRDVNDAPFPQEYGFEESLTSFEGMGDRILYLDNGNTHGLSNQNADVPGSIEWVEWELGADKHTDAAISFIQNAVSQNEPFFIFVPHDDTHAPYDTDPGKEEDFDHVAGMANNTTGKLFLSELNELDKEIGRLVNAIDTLGVGGETLIVLVGDNGAPVGGINDTLMRNGDLRGGKKRLWEGGIREPFLVRMPGTVPANAVNTTTAVSTLDLFPTFCSMAGLPLPDVPFGGEDMWDVFTGSTRPRVKPLYWEFATNPNIDAAGPKLAMREGHLKLMMDPDGTDRYLFDLSTNRQEADSGNLINTPSFADTVNSMEVRLLTWYQEVMFGVTN
ncbi:MAG: sulfatase-like hydrolase/transferase, partial [Verrucomicrobiota bacterium]